MKEKAHIRYRDSKGNIVVGVTTALNILNKPALVKWANQLGLKGIDSSKYVDERKQIGTLTHEMIMAFLKKEKQDISDYSPNQVKKAKNSFYSFLEWWKDRHIEPILVEEPLVSDIHGFGGTPDLLAKINGNNHLIDFKTGSGIFDEALIQVIAYKRLLVENGYQVDKVRILRIPRSEDDEFEDRRVGKHEIAWRVFLDCLDIYKLKKQMREK